MIEATIECLVDQGHQVLVFATSSAVKNYPKIDVVRISGIKALYPDIVVTWPHPKIFYHLKRFAPDIVHLANPINIGVWGMIYSKMLKIPVLTSYHTHIVEYKKLYSINKFLDPYLRKMVDLLITAIHKKGDKIIAASAESARFLEPLVSRTVDVWRGSLDRTLFSPSKRSDELRKKYHVGDHEKIILHVGRLALEKSINNLKVLLDLNKDTWLWIVGNGPLKDELTHLLSSEKTIFFGQVTGEELAKIYASADVFAMPSTTETLGFVTMEALSSGLPVVAAKAGGTVGLVSHEMDGYLYNPDNLEELKKFVSLLINDDTLRDSCSKNAIIKSTTFSSWQEETEKLYGFYLEAIKNRKESCSTLKKN